MERMDREDAMVANYDPADHARGVDDPEGQAPEDGELAHPRPWLRFQHDKHDFSLLSFGGEIAHVEAEEADFEFILRAVNSFDAADALYESAKAVFYDTEQLGPRGTGRLMCPRCLKTWEWDKPQEHMKGCHNGDLADALAAYRKASEHPE